MISQNDLETLFEIFARMNIEDIQRTLTAAAITTTKSNIEAIGILEAVKHELLISFMSKTAFMNQVKGELSGESFNKKMYGYDPNLKHGDDKNGK